MILKYVRILLILGMTAVMCGAGSAAGMSVVAETHETSGINAPACTAPCECMSLTQAMQRWGTEGYDYCSKTVCGQSADADVQYYCLHQKAGPAEAVATPQAPSQAPPAGSPAAAGSGQKTPLGLATAIAAIGAVLLAGSCLRRK